MENPIDTAAIHEGYAKDTRAMVKPIPVPLIGAKQGHFRGV